MTRTRICNVKEGIREFDVYNFGILLLKLASGKKPIEKINDTMKRTITDWALPLEHEGKFREIADPRLNTNYVEEELNRVVLVTLIYAQNRPEKRPTMIEVIELLKGESKDKFTVWKMMKCSRFLQLWAMMLCQEKKAMQTLLHQMKKNQNEKLKRVTQRERQRLQMDLLKRWDATYSELTAHMHCYSCFKQYGKNAEHINSLLSGLSVSRFMLLGTRLLIYECHVSIQ